MEVLLLIVAVWAIVSWFSKKKRTSGSNNDSTKTLETPTITEEDVHKAQAIFEERLSMTYLPDSIHRQDSYVYRNLVLPWYKELIAKHRYDDSMSQKLRDDFLDYMSAIDDRSTTNYLWMESYDEDDENAGQDYRDRHIAESKKAFAIEEGFACAMGEDAKKELTRIRKMDTLKFNRLGTELAPDGKEYDLSGEKLVDSKE